MNGDEFSATSESAAGHQIYSNLFKFRGVSTQRSCLDEIMTHLSALQLLHGATTNGSLAIRVSAQALAACKRRSALASRCLVAISLRAWQLKITSIPRMTSSATAAAASASRGPTSLIGTQLSPQTAPSLIFWKVHCSRPKTRSRRSLSGPNLVHCLLYGLLSDLGCSGDHPSSYRREFRQVPLPPPPPPGQPDSVQIL